MKTIFRSRLFWIGLALKLVALPFFGSTYLRDLFIPFMDNAVLHVGTNPWSLSPSYMFPYGSVLFSILFVPRWIAHAVFGSAALGQTALSVALIKLPLLLIDVLFFAAICRWTNNVRRAAVYYWLNPVLFYITYVHGQLDIASTAFCFLSLMYLSRARVARSAVLMALSTLCKFHVVILVPLLLAYIWNNEFARAALRKIGMWLVVWGGLCALGFLPTVLANRIAYVTVSSPQAMTLFGVQIGLGENHVLFLGLAIVLLVLGRLCVSTRITDRALMYGSGVLFGSLVLATDAAQGWYFWVVPFLALFYIDYFSNHSILLWLFSAAYLVCFGLVRDYGVVSWPMAYDIAFTATQVLLFGVVMEMWIVVIKREMPLLGRLKPFVIGIAGDSGTGKNTLTQQFMSLLGDENVVMIEGDNYHRWERTESKWKSFTHLDPEANLLPMLYGHMDALIKGQYVWQPVYDHATGHFNVPKEMKPSKTVIVQGLHALFLRQMRTRLDIRIFLQPDRRVQLFWKLNRDVKERGHSIQSVRDSLAARDRDAEAYIKPQNIYADWIVEFFPIEDIIDQQILAGQEPALGVHHIFWNDAPVQAVTRALQTLPGSEVRVDPLPNDINRVSIRVSGRYSSEQIAALARDLFPDVRQITRGHAPPVWQEGLRGVNQLFALALIAERQK